MAAEQQDTGNRETRKRASQLSSVQVMFAAILAVGLVLAINFSRRIAAGQPLQEAYNRAVAEVVELREEQVDLIQQRDYVRSDAYVENWARDAGKMVREGEVLVVPVPSGVSLPATPEVAVEVPVQTTPPEPQTWQLWWALFFDTKPPAW